MLEQGYRLLHLNYGAQLLDDAGKYLTQNFHLASFFRLELSKHAYSDHHGIQPFKASDMLFRVSSTIFLTGSQSGCDSALIELDYSTYSS